MVPEQHFLLSLLAFQNGFISQPQLLNAVASWIADKSKPLSDILVEQGALPAKQLQILEQLVKLHLEQFDGNAGASLAALSIDSSLQAQLNTLALDDRQLSVSIMQLKRADKLPEPITKDDSGSVDRFRIVKEHAAGGLGVVFVAEDTQIRREVALKQIRGDRAGSLEYRSKFVSEAEITGQLEHPGIVPVYSLGADSTGNPYYAMRFIRGENLQDRLRDFHARKKANQFELDCSEFRGLLRRFIDVCNAIDYAHDRGVLHRDLKPGNVMLGKHGETLVVDWGLAKPYHRQTASDPFSTIDFNAENSIRSKESGESATQFGAFVGTPGYTPPEQALGHLDRLGPASDVYSLGAILYEILTGTVPITGASLQEIIAKCAAGDFANPRSIDADVPVALEAVCLKAMRLDPSQRYPSAKELREEVERWLNDEPVLENKEGPITRLNRWVRHHPALTAGIATSCFLLLVGAFVFLGVSEGHVRALERKNIKLAEVTKEVSEKNEAIKQSSQELSNSLQQLSINMTESENTAKNFRRQTAQRAIRTAVLASQNSLNEIATSGFISAFQLSKEFPDLHESVTRIAWGHLASTCLAVIPPAENATISNDPLRFSADGRLFITEVDGFARFWKTRSGEPVGKLPSQPQGIHRASFSPNGKYVAIVPKSSMQIQLLLEENMAPVGSPIAVPGEVDSIQFSNDGSKLACSTVTGMVHVCDIDSRKVLFSLDLRERIAFFEFNFDGSRLLVSSMNGALELWDAINGIRIKDLTFHNRGTIKGGFSVSGSRIHAFLPSSTQVYSWNSTSGEAIGEPILHEKVMLLSSSTNGEYIATASPNAVQIFREDEGWKLVEQIPLASSVEFMEFKASGDFLTVGCHNGTVTTIESSTGKSSVSIIDNSNYPITVASSRDGNFIATNSSNAVQLWDAKRHSRIGLRIYQESPVDFMKFSPDGKSLLCVSRDGFLRLYQTGWQREISSAENTTTVEIGPRGRAIAFGTNEGSLSLQELESGELRWKANLAGKTPIKMITFSEDESLVAVSEEGDCVAIVDAKTGNQIGKTIDCEGVAMNMAFSPDTKFLATNVNSDSTGSCSIKIWEVGSSTMMKRIPYQDQDVKVRQHLPWLRSWAISPDSSKIALMNRASGEIWPLVGAQNTPVHFAENAFSMFRLLRFSPSGDLVASYIFSGYEATSRYSEKFVAPSNFAMLSSSATGQEIVSENKVQHYQPITTMVFSRDGSCLATGSNDKTVKLWSLPSCRQIGDAMVHDDNVTSVRFSEDGKLLVTGALDAKVRIWDVNSTLQVCPAFSFSDGIIDAGFSDDQRSVFVKSFVNSILNVSGLLAINTDRIQSRLELISGYTATKDGNAIKLKYEERLSIFNELYPLSN